MLYIDGISLAKLKEELKDLLKSRRATKVYQYSNLNLSIFFGKINLYMSASPNLPICYISTKKEVALDKPMGFSLSLRKHLVGAILVDIEQYKSDRILLLTFEKINELGEKKKVILIIEIMGKHSNIILVDSNMMILDLLKKFSLEENRLRLLMSGAKYEFPIINEKKSAFDISEDEFVEYKNNDELISKVQGIGKISNKYIQTYSDYKNMLETSSPTLYRSEDGIVYGTFYEYDIKDLKRESFTSINEMIDLYIIETLSSGQFSNQKKILSKVVEKEIKRNKKTLKNIKKDILKYETYEKYKIIGDILAANLYSLKGYEKEVELYNFYTNENITIILNPQKTSSENLENYYKLYNKQKRGYGYSLDRLEVIKKELIYLESLLSFINLATDKKTLEGIEEELIVNRYIKKITKGKKKKKISKILPPKVEIDNIVVYYGRNNTENEYVTFKIGERHDLWFHAKDVPGCHLIAKASELSEETIYKIGELVSQHSKVGVGETVRVDYCHKKYVKKVKGGKPGFVIYSNEKSILVKRKLIKN